MMVVSLTAVCQYPVTKKIKDVDVVIMTTKQAEDINYRFTKMKDSISILKEQILSIKENNSKLIRSNSTLLDSIKNTNVELRDTRNSLNWYRKDNQEYRDSFISLSKEHRQSIFGITLSAAIFTAAVVILGRNL